MTWAGIYSSLIMPVSLLVLTQALNLIQIPHGIKIGWKDIVSAGTALFADPSCLPSSSSTSSREGTFSRTNRFGHQGRSTPMGRSWSAATCSCGSGGIRGLSLGKIPLNFIKGERTSDGQRLEIREGHLSDWGNLTLCRFLPEIIEQKVLWISLACVHVRN